MTRHILISILLAMSLLSGCSKQLVPPIPSLARTPADRADRAFSAMQYETARAMYRTLLSQPGPSASVRGLYFERMITSGISLNDTAGARQDLARWASEDPGAEDTLAWQRLHLQLAAQTLSGPQYLTAVQETLNRPNLPWQSKQTLGAEQFETQWQAGARMDALLLSAALHRAAPDQTGRQELERNMLALAGSMAPEVREELLAAAPETEKQYFPFSLVAWAQGQHLLALSPDNWLAAHKLLRLAPFSADLADREWFRNELAGLEHHFGPASRSVAMLLPLSGPLRKIGREIAQGAQCGLLAVRNPEQISELRFINSEGQDWESELAALGPEFRIVGGPLRSSVWQKLRQESLHAERMFLTFMSSMEGEGREGWRFFGSPADQARTVIQAAIQEHGITSFAVFYPKEHFGSTMAEAFWNEAAAAGCSISDMASYPPNSPRELGGAVAGLLKAPPAGSEQETPPPDFQAVFLPDSLNRAQMIAPQFFFYDAKELLFLGPQIWNQGFLSGSKPELQYLSRALFPGAWWPTSPDPEMARLQQEFSRKNWGAPGFWAGLGYDFIRFAGEMNDASPLGAPERIAAILHETAMTMQGWTMAPLDWDASGNARQTMFLFRPSSDGPVRVRQNALPAPDSRPAVPAPSRREAPSLTETNIAS